MKTPRPFSYVLLAAFAAGSAFAASAAKPLKVLLVTGGCCHDYVRQKDILKEGIERRANAVVDHMHTPDKSTRPPLPHYNQADYAKGYDIVIHGECAAAVEEPELVRNVLAPHQAGVPAVVLHCAMHSFRVVKDYARPQAPDSPGGLWFDFLGLQSSRHGPQAPVAITFTDSKHPITLGMKDWTTGNEELYNNVQPPKTYARHHSLATGHQKGTDKKGKSFEDTAVVIWTNEYGPKRARVFGTTLGHNNATVEDPRFLDLVARGLLWAVDKLGADGKPVAGYGPVTR